jgi:5-methylcytosine-specific restriction endonuclease McrA
VAGRDPVKDRAWHSAWAKAHRDLCNARNARWRKANPEKIRAKNARQRAQHPERYRAAIAAWTKAHPEQVRAKSKAWSDANPEKRRASVAKYAKANPEKDRARVKRHHARKMQAPVNDFTAEQWQAMKEHYQHCCVYCGKKQQRLTQDHIVPLSKGGSHTYSNIVPACRSCNSKKGTGAPLIPVQPLLCL